MVKMTANQKEAFTLPITVTDAKGEGPLTTRTSNTVGVATLGAGHGIETGDVVVVSWDGGRRDAVTVGTVSGSTVPLTDSGSGDSYPAEDTVLAVRRTVNVSGATITMWVKRQLDGSTSGYLIQKADTDFTKSYGGFNYKVAVAFDEEDLDWYGSAYGIIQFEIAEGNIKKVIFEVELTRTPEPPPEPEA